MLSERNVRRLRDQNGAAILYTHFGKGFVALQNGRPVLNAESRARLRYVAAQDTGWFSPVGDLLDRLLAFQKVLVGSFAGGFAIRNENASPVRDLTLLAQPGAAFFSPEAASWTADHLGRLLIAEIAAGQTLLFFHRDLSASMRNWLAPEAPAWLQDLREIARRLGDRIPRPARRSHTAAEPPRSWVAE